MRLVTHKIAGVFGLLAGHVFLQAEPLDQQAVIELEPVTVFGESLSASHTAGPQSLDTYDASLIDGSGAFSVNEFIGSLSDAEDGGTTLVLIDGRPTYLDPGSLPLGMIASIEVSDDGSMPQYGEFHDGRIINIRLKPHYSSSELGSKFEGSVAGGGATRTARYAGATTRDKLQAIYSLEYSERLPLLATERDFSSNQDHRDRGGRDLRLGWGQLAVVKASEGWLEGVYDADGAPVRTALVPAGQDGEGLTPQDFLPPDPSIGDRASGQRRFDTAPYRWLVSPSRNVSANLGFTYSFSEQLRGTFTVSRRDSRGERLGPPPTSPASDKTVVPAAYNPFGQDVSVGLVHEAFGPTRQSTRGRRDELGLQFDGELAGDWSWEAGIGLRRSSSERTGVELDPEKFSYALAAEDPAQRFNPFADSRVFDRNAALYPNLTSIRTSDDFSERVESEISLKGPAFSLPGGTAQLKVKARADERRRERLSTRILGDDPELNQFEDGERSLSSSLKLPFVGSDNAISLIRRLDIDLVGKYESSDQGAREVDRETSVVWSPIQSLLFRARVRQSVDRPVRAAIAGSETLVGESLVDPLRGGETIAAVRLFERELIAASEEEEARYELGVVYEPSFVSGLELKLNYREREERGKFEDDFDPQEIVNNERVFGDRVYREDPSASDLLAGQPGRIVAVDRTPGSTGAAGRREVEFKLNYFLPENPTGRWRFTADVDRYLSAYYDVLPGVPYVTEGLSRYRRPPWRAEARVTWNKGQWNGSVRGRHVEALEATDGAFNALGGSTTVDLNLGRRWRLPDSGYDRKRDLKLMFSVDNVFDQDPPVADTVSGYRGGSPLGRTYSAAATLEF